jgi:kumamolisin
LSLESIVVGVFGLDDRKQVRPFFRPRKLLTKLDVATADMEHKPYSPVELAKLYNFPSELDGSSQCIGILEFGGGFGNSDLESYFNKIGISS